MRTSTLIQRTVVLLGLIAIIATSVNAQGPDFGDLEGWGGGSNPFNTNPSSSDGGSSSNGDDNGSGSSSGSGSDSGSGSESGSESGSGSGSGSGSDSGSNSNNGGSSSNNNIGSSNGGSSPSSFGPGLAGYNPYATGLTYASFESYRAAHGILAAVSFAFLFPFGAILMRVVPGKPPVAAHGGIQLIAYALYVAAAGLGLYLVSTVRLVGPGADYGGLLDSARTNAHPIIGIVLLVALLSQPVWGLLHHRRFARLRRRTWPSHVHLWLGRVGITLGIINGGLGLALAGTTGTFVVAYAVVAGVMWLLWLLAALYGERKGARKEKRMDKIMEEDRGYVPGIRGGRGVYRPSATPPPSLPEEQGAAAAAPGDDGLAHPPPVVVPMDMPSPPYTPGPNYEAHMANVQQRQQQQQQQQQQQSVRREMENMKQDIDSVSILSASPDEMQRGQV
ncbi:hypothetical protein F4825DRAFT_468968 [Nemania diffusa]|nr:hypothetical protein F4825DRAFT_468968 [Nemania diffusa]